VPDSPSELLAWIASTLEGYDETAVTNVSTALQRRLTKSRLARCSREDFVCLLSGTFDETTARDIAVDLHQSIHEGSGQSSQVPSDRFTKATDTLLMLLKNMLQVKPIEESSAHQYDVPAWFNNVKTYYFGAELRPCCSVLGFLFTAPNYDFSIRVVAEHLIPRRQAMAAGIDVHDERNGVILCKHLERLLQAGQWSLVPVSCDASANMLSCRIHVSNTELETELNDIGFVDSERRPLV